MSFDFDAKIFDRKNFFNSSVVNNVIIEHRVVLMSNVHVNTFVWVEVHVSSGGPLR